MTVIPNPPSLGDTFTNDSTGVSYSYDGSKWVVTSTPADQDLSELSADVSVLTQRVADGETIQSDIQQTITTALGTQSEIQQNISDALDTQSEIQEDVSTLEAKVQALEGTVTDGTWRFTSRGAPLQGEFDLLDGTGNKINGNWSLAQFIYFTNPDYLNVNHTFEFLGLEDYIRIGGAGGSAVYRVKSGKTESSGIIEYQVEHVSSSGVVLESFAHDFEFTPGFDPTAYATIDYVDEQDVKAVKKAGTNTVEDNFKIKTASKTFISVGDELKLYHVADPTGNDDGWAANKGYVDTEASKLDSKIDTAVEPLSTRDYVDQAVADAVAPDLSSYATKTFAEDLTYRPARLRWLFEGKDLGNTKPANQSFKFDGKFIRISFNTFNGVDLGASKIGDTGAINFTDGPVGIIWYKDANFKWKMKQQFRINSWRWNYNGHFEFARSSKHPLDSDDSFTVGATYYITVGGFF